MVGRTTMKITIQYDKQYTAGAITGSNMENR